MSSVDELIDKFNDAAHLQKQNPAAVTSSNMTGTMPGQDESVKEASAAMPPEMAFVKQHTADEVVQMLNRMPLFMTSLDETDGEGGENAELEALKALAYEGTRAEIAGNFREQGNEQARLKRWADAKPFYDKALAALKGLAQEQGKREGEAEVELKEVDEMEERKKEREIEEACLVNRALCNLELSASMHHPYYTMLGESADSIHQKTTAPAPSTAQPHSASTPSTSRPGTAPPPPASPSTSSPKPTTPAPAASKSTAATPRSRLWPRRSPSARRTSKPSPASAASARSAREPKQRR